MTSFYRQTKIIVIILSSTFISIRVLKFVVRAILNIRNFQLFRTHITNQQTYSYLYFFLLFRCTCWFFLRIFRNCRSLPSIRTLYTFFNFGVIFNCCHVVSGFCCIPLAAPCWEKLHFMNTRVRKLAKSLFRCCCCYC